MLIRLPSGKRLERLFHRTDVVKSVFAVIASDAEMAEKDFCVYTSFPATDIGEKMQLTIEEAGLLTCQVTVRYK